MKKALFLFVLIVVGIVGVACNPPATTADAVKTHQGAANPDGTKGGPGAAAQQPAN
jgi:hypothetical protein